jgi:hypothetical protein
LKKNNFAAAGPQQKEGRTLQKKGEKMKKLMAICAVVTIFLAVSSVAQATLSWQTEPVLGTSTYIYDNPAGCSDVIVVTDVGLVNIPHDVLNGGTPTGMTVFNVGQTVDAGSGIYYAPENETYYWSVVYTGPSRIVSYADAYPGDSGEGFVMNYLDPVSTLTAADIGNWTYVETWTDAADPTHPLIYSTNFQVIPEPATIALLGLGSLTLLRRKRIT